MSVESKKTHVSGFQTATRTITQAEILTAKSSPVTVISAPGPNKLIWVLAVAYSIKAGSAPFVGNVSGFWGLYYGGNTTKGQLGYLIRATNLTDSNVNLKGLTLSHSYGPNMDPAFAVNQPVMFSSEADYTNAGSGASIKVTVYYTIVDVS